MIWIVTWLVISHTLTTCPNNEPYTDEYGIYHASKILTDQLCYRSDTTFHNREFRSREEAVKFIKNAPRPVPFIYFKEPYCENMKLDSLKVR